MSGRVVDGDLGRLRVRSAGVKDDSGAGAARDRAFGVTVSDEAVGVVHFELDPEPESSDMVERVNLWVAEKPFADLVADVDSSVSVLMISSLLGLRLMRFVFVGRPPLVGIELLSLALN